MSLFRKLIIGALICLVVTSGIVYMIARSIQKAKTDTARAVQTWHYLAVTRDIGAGEKLNQKDLTTITWSSSLPVDGALESETDAVGHLLSYPLSSGMIITRKALAPPNSSVGLSRKIPTGMRAIALKTDDQSDFGGFLFPGSKVDVLVNNAGRGGAQQFSAGPLSRASMTSSAAKTVLLLENIEVLATGKQLIADPASKPKEETIITLLVSPEDARKVALAQEQGSIHLILRNTGDIDVSGPKATSINEISDIRTNEEKAQPLVKIPTFTIAPKVKRVQVILGTKSYSQAYRNNIPIDEPAVAPATSPQASMPATPAPQNDNSAPGGSNQ